MELKNMEISNDVKTHVIVFKDGSMKHVNRGENSVIEDAMRAKSNGVKISGGYIDFKVIAKYLTSQEYLKQYPQNRPSRYEDFTGTARFPRKKSPAEKKTAMVGMILGLEGYINSQRYQGTPETKLILAKMKDRLRKIESGEDVNVEPSEFLKAKV